ARCRDADGAGSQGERRRYQAEAGGGEQLRRVETIVAEGARQGRSTGTGPLDGACQDIRVRGTSAQGQRSGSRPQAGGGRQRGGAAKILAAGARARSADAAGSPGGAARWRDTDGAA